MEWKSRKFCFYGRGIRKGHRLTIFAGKGLPESGFGADDDEFGNCGTDMGLFTVDVQKAGAVK